MTLEYKTVRSRLFEEARRSHPPPPVLLMGMGAALNGYEPFTRNFRSEIRSEDGGTAVLFTTDILLEELNNASEIYIDGTFKVKRRTISLLNFCHFNERSFIIL